MDFKSLLPNFSEIAKTDWSKPQLDSKDTLGVAAMLSVVLMIIFTLVLIGATASSVTSQEKPYISKMMTQDYHFYKVIILHLLI